MKTTTLIVILLALIPLSFAGTSGPSPVPNPPTFSITSSSPMLCAGQVNNIPFAVTNKGAGTGLSSNGIEGAQMQSVELSITSSKAFSNIGNGISNAISVNPNSTGVTYVPVFVSTNTSSIVTAEVNINYNYYGLYSDGETRNVSFEVGHCSSPLTIIMTPQVLTTGNIQNITLKVENTGTTTLNSIAVHISTPSSDAAWLTSMPIEISSISPHTSINETASAFVSKNATLSVPVNITAVYYNGTTIEELSNDIMALSTGLVNLTSSSFATSPSAPTTPGIFSLSFIITDIGTSGASAVMVTPLPPPGVTSYGSNSVFVGDVGVDTQTPVTLSLIASNSIRSGSYKLPIRINYINNLRQNVTAWANTSIFLSPAAFNFSKSGQVVVRNGSSGDGGLLIIVLVVIIIVLGYMLWRERKRRGR